jgi:Zn-dependent M28 family amino/carboxypeptidase
MKSYRLAALLLGSSAVLSGAWAAADIGPQLGLPANASVSMQGIEPKRIAEHVRFLANDLLEGRGTGTRGGDIAANYIATQFALYGLQPAGDDGTYLQKVAFVGVKTLPSTSAAFLPAHGAAVDLKLAEDYVAGNQTQTDSADIDAPIVFVGYGIQAPEYKWDDFKGVDVKGKVVLVIVNEPPSKDAKFFNAEALTYYGRWTYKFEQAARKGAVGALIIHRTDLASYGWDVVRNSWSGEQVYLGNDNDPKLKAASWIQLEVARKLFSASNLNLDEMIAAAGTRSFQAKELPVRFKAHIDSKVRKFESYNVLGILPGKDAAGSQAIVYSAHYDHLGIDASMSGDNIYNGAVDNGTGCGILLELARAFTTSTARPPSAVLFAAVTAEEKGLLGSNYLGKHLPIAAGKIALDLNYDAILPIGIPQSVTLTGAERTTFYPTVEKTAALFGFEIQADAEPGAGHYYRSDHFSMARAGVPAFSVGSGVKFVGHTVEWGKAQHEEYTAKRYHRPSDEFTADMDFSSDAAVAKFGFALGWQAMLAKGTVNWLPGDEFEAVRLHGAAH